VTTLEKVTAISPVTFVNRLTVLLLTFSLLLSIVPTSAAATARKCPPTPPDEIGPFYRPNSPQRSKIGNGYVLHGTVRSAATCQPIPGARIEFWQAGPDGKYGDAYRATIYADSKGHYRLTTSIPPPYARRPAHIHILADMRDYAGLITQHYPKAGKRTARFDLVLETE
jgi:protocatechuate 3,4-dioxygenase beta subunit